MVLWVWVMAGPVMARVREAVLVTVGPLMAVVRSVTVRAGPAVRALALRGLPARWAVREAQALG